MKRKRGSSRSSPAMSSLVVPGMAGSACDRDESHTISNLENGEGAALPPVLIICCQRMTTSGAALRSASGRRRRRLQYACSTGRNCVGALQFVSEVTAPGSAGDRGGANRYAA